MKYKLGFIGAGVMAGSILERIISTGKLNDFGFKPSDIAVYDLDETKRIKFADMGVSVALSSEELLAESDTVLLGVKPQFYADILKAAPSINVKNVISIMAGVKIANLRKYFTPETGITRVMPNTPCRIGKGIAAVTFDNTDEAHEALVKGLLGVCGAVIVLAESKFDAVTSISGSGPAYVFMFADAMVRAGVEGGLSVEESRALTLATIEGSAAFASIAGEDLLTMTDKVCSKGGTTIEAVDVFRAKDLYGTVSEAIGACRKKSKFLSEKL